MAVSLASMSDRELLRLYHEQGDPTAREVLVQRHLPLVRSLARRYAGRGEALEDIEQVGAIGLIKAIDRYELSRDVALTTYATPNVVGEIKRHFRDKGWAIRVPRALQELNVKMSGALERLTAKLGRSPTIAELAEELDATPNVVGEIKRHFRDKGWAIRVPRALQELNGKMGPTIERLTSKLGRSPSIAEIAREFQTTPEQVLEAMEAGSAYAPQSLSAGPDSDSELDPMETIGSEDEEFARTDERTSLEPALASLPEREQLILKLRFEDGLTQTQIAEKIGISQMHVSRLIRRSLDRMREQLG